MSNKSKAEKQAALKTEAPKAAAKPVIANIPEEKEEAAAAVKEPAAPKEPGKIKQILDLFLSGKTNKEIVEAGFHKTTVAIQVAKYKKAHPDQYPPKVKEPKVKKEKEAAAEATEEKTA